MSKEYYAASSTELVDEGPMRTQSWQRVLVCGGRLFGYEASATKPSERAERTLEREFLDNVLDEFYEVFSFTDLCHGDATGADRLAGTWAISKSSIYQVKITVHKYPANWEKYGKAAGPIRNQQMLEVFRPDVVLAFPGGKGTENMKTLARNAGVRVVCPTP